MPVPDAFPSWRVLQRSAADDAYTSWFNAQRRCAEALRAWLAATSEDRAAAYRVYLLTLDLEEMAAAELERALPRRLAA
jgi:hypothetical protein